MQSFRETEVLWKSESCCFVYLKNPFYSYLHAFLNKTFVKKCWQFAYLSYLTHFHILLQRDIKDHTSRLQCTLCFCSSTSAHMHTVWFFYNCVVLLFFFLFFCVHVYVHSHHVCLPLHVSCLWTADEPWPKNNTQSQLGWGRSTLHWIDGSCWQRSVFVGARARKKDIVYVIRFCYRRQCVG